MNPKFLFFGGRGVTKCYCGTFVLGLSVHLVGDLLKLLINIAMNRLLTASGVCSFVT